MAEVPKRIVSAAVAAKAVAQQELSKREQARLQRAALLAEQEKLQKLLELTLFLTGLNVQ